MAGKGKKKPTGTNNQPKKKKKKRKKPGDSHYCWVCGTHKAHEKFSGRGHATHMCKQCHALPVAERNEMVAARKADNMAFRHLTEQEIKWLRKRMNDPRQEVRDAAREAHRIKFPRYERNMAKKGLTARSLEFYINGEVWDEWGDEIPVHMRFVIPDNSGVIKRIDYNAQEGEQETSINIGHSPALKFLKAVIHQLDALFWSEDFSDAGDGDYDYDPYDLYMDDDDTDEEDEDDKNENSDDKPTTEDREPIWSLRLLLTKGMGENVQTFYNQMHEAPQDLYWSLMEWFEPDDEDEYDEFDEDAATDG